MATPSAITGPFARASHPDQYSAVCALERECQAGFSSHAARIARSNAVPRIERVPCVLCLVCLCYQAQCVVSRTTVAPAMPSATLETQAPVPLHLLQYSAGYMSQSFLRLRVSLACLCTCADFVRPTNRVIKHKVLCVCVLGPCFLRVWTISVTGFHVSQDKQAPSRLFEATSWVFACTHAHTLGYECM